ncbi:MAG: hypothetical protein V4622_01810 [Bacteroidota bacterium]
MNKHFLLVFFALFLNFQIFSQEVQTIVIKKEKTLLFQGVNEEVVNWYFFIDSDSLCYLANLTIPFEEIENWFISRKNSNNIFKGKIDLGQYSTLTLTKDNDQETSMNFYVEYESESKLFLVSIEDGLVYEFMKK